MNRKILIILVASFIGTQVSADSVTVPNTFVDGATASASEVNANFDALASAVNSVRSINVYVNDVRRGALLEPMGGSIVAAYALRILLDTRYTALLSTVGDGLYRVAPLVYESANCTGQPYIPMNGWNPIMARQGIVFANDTPALGTLYFVFAGTAVETITMESSSKDGVCTPTGTTPNTDAAKVDFNDSALTGVKQSDFIGDVTIGF